MGKLKAYKKHLKPAVILLVLVPIGIFVYHTDFDIVKSELYRTGWQFVHIIGITFLAYLLGTISWHVCLGAKRHQITVLKLFAIRQIGETVGLYNPTSIVGGDLVKAELLRQQGIDHEIALNSVAISRITAILSQLALFLLGMIGLLLLYKQHIDPMLAKVIYVIILVLVVAKALLFYWLTRPPNPQVSEQTTNSLVQRIKKQLKIHLVDIQFFFHHERKTFWSSYFFALAHWLVGCLEFYLILLFLGIPVQMLQALILDMGVIVIKSLGAFIPGQLGIEELGNKFMLTLIGISSGTIWITVSILRRARQLCWIAIGFCLYPLINKKTIYSTT